MIDTLTSANRKLNPKIIPLILILLLFRPGCDLVAGGVKKRISGNAGEIQHRSSVMNINNISMWASDDGMMEQNPKDQTPGVSFPRGMTTVVSKGGIVWGGKVMDGNSQIIRVGGQTYRSGTTPGRIIAPGVAEGAGNPGVRIYRIRRDWDKADLLKDASEFFDISEFDVTEQDVQALRDQYKKDWLEWPWQKGAPYYERNGIPGYQPNPSGVYDSTGDEPGLGEADQVLWYCSNDLNSISTHALYGCMPVGIEMQVTCWAYNHFEKLKNVLFQRYRLIYKGTGTTPFSSSIDSMYLAKWVDSDIGNYSDDYAGCDINRNLGYGYNAHQEDDEFTKFRLTPAVVGYTLLQGPRVPKSGSSAKWNLSDIDGYENLPMTTFTYFNNGLRLNDYDLGSYVGAQGWYNLMRGFKHKPISPPACLIDNFTNQCTHYDLSGDPQLFHGWIDGQPDSAGDRRFALISGPFSMSPGDTQEVVFGLVAGTGTNNRSGIGVIQKYADAAHDAYQVNFTFPAPVPAPHVKMVELDNKLIFDWESDTTALKRVESYSSRGYRFESYIIYQLPAPGAPRDQAVVYQFFDPTQPRLVYITQDKLRNKPLVDGQKYYFAVTTSVYNPDPLMTESRLESEMIIHEVTPHTPDPGIVYPYAIGDTLTGIKNIYGENDGVVNVLYFDPSKADGHPYQILYHRNQDPWIDFDEKPRWSLIDEVTGDTLISRAVTDAPPQRVITKGFSVEALYPKHRLKDVVQSQYKYQPTHDLIFDTPNPAGDLMIVGPGSSTLDTLKGYHHADSDIEVRFLGDSSWTILMGPTAVTSKWVRVPYTAWERRVRGTDTLYRRLFTTIFNENNDSLWRPSDILHRTYAGKPMKVFQSISFIIDSVETEAGSFGGTYYDDLPYRPDAAHYRGFLWLHGQYWATKVSVSRAFIADLDDDGSPAPPGTVVRIEPYKEIRDGEKKYFISRAIDTNNYAAAKREVDRINVFPNPYYGMNRAERNRFQRFVTFNHLPRIANIRIFNLAGIPVRTIVKDDPSQFITWDLNNENGLPVGGGLYLAHFELRDKLYKYLGEKTLKLMIVPEDQSPENN